MCLGAHFASVIFSFFFFAVVAVEFQLFICRHVEHALGLRLLCLSGALFCWRSSSMETLQYALITVLRMYTSNDFALFLTSSARRTSLKRNQMKGKTYFTRMHSHGQLLFKSKLKSKLQCDPCSLTAGRLFSWLDASGCQWMLVDAFGFHLMFWKRFANEITR